MTVGRILPLVQLVGHKLLHRTRDAFDERSGIARAERRARQRVRQGFASSGSMSQWLERPGAGRLWLPFRAARRWAAMTCSAADLVWAEDIVAGRYHLLGTAVQNLGNPPRWHQDLYSGLSWPMQWASRLPLSRGDGSDIRTVWELSRCYHFVPLAKAYWRTGEQRFLDTFCGHVESWLQQNPAGFGANWRSPMDAALRAANWALGAVLFAEAPGVPRELWVSLLTNLRVTARYVAGQLEWHPLYRGNHYISNAVGLAYVGALFRDDPEGAQWLRTGAAILRREMQYQVRPDGVNGEAAIGYHRLVTEFFTYAGEVCDANLPGVLPSAYWQRLRAMYGFIAAYLDTEGLAPLLGDADDGRLHLLCAESAERPAAHRLGLRPKYWPAKDPASAAFPDGGFFVLRSRGSRAVVRCGAVGLRGAGSHDHNDQLAYELSLGGVPIISDSGTYAYTRDLAERFAFRSTAAHNAVQLGDEEQNPIRVERPWRMLADRTRSRCTAWRADAQGACFAGQHSGFAHRASGATCSRSVAVVYESDEWTIQDRVEGQGRESVTWRTHFAPGLVSARQVAPSSWAIEHERMPGYSFLVDSSAPLSLRVDESRRSERYGVWERRPVLVLQGEAELPLEITLRVRRLP